MSGRHFPPSIALFLPAAAGGDYRLTVITPKQKLEGPTEQSLLLLKAESCRANVPIGPGMMRIRKKGRGNRAPMSLVYYLIAMSGTPS